MTDPAQDIHMWTVEHDTAFHAYMDRLTELGLQDDWRNWPDNRKRMAAKEWNFTKMYGIGERGLR